jgi:hypothetical protein
LVLTPDRKQYLYCLRDYTETHHTGQFLAAEIKTVLTKIGVKKFSAVVTDNAANVKLARELISKEYPRIINIRCIAHFINLITKSIIGSIFRILLAKKIFIFNILHFYMR